MYLKYATCAVLLLLISGVLVFGLSFLLLAAWNISLPNWLMIGGITILACFLWATKESWRSIMEWICEVKQIWEWNREMAAIRRRVVELDTEVWQNKRFEGLERIGGVDISYSDGLACAGLVVLEFPGMRVIHKDLQMVDVPIEYKHGYMAFRERQPLLELLEKLKEEQPTLFPQVVFVDGNGVLNEHQAGLACHIGVKMGITCVSVCKNLPLVLGLSMDSEYRKQCALLNKGDSFPMRAASGKILCEALLCGNDTKNPIFVSVGHKISLRTAVLLTIALDSPHRIPVPIGLIPGDPGFPW